MPVKVTGQIKGKKIKNTIKDGTIVGEGKYLKVMNTQNRRNYIEAHYESSAGRKK